MKPTHPELLTAASGMTCWLLVIAILAVLDRLQLHPLQSLLLSFAALTAVSVIARRYFKARARRRGEHWPERP